MMLMQDLWYPTPPFADPSYSSVLSMPRCLKTVPDNSHLLRECSKAPGTFFILI